MIKNYDFQCPHCNAMLNSGGYITLQTKRSNGELGTIKMATSVGNYDYTHEPPTEFEAGEVVEFRCTSCHISLNSEEFEDYAQLKMKVRESIEFDILFSRKAGVQKTYLITEDGIETYSGN
jgi:hypothetical protein